MGTARIRSRERWSLVATRTGALRSSVLVVALQQLDDLGHLLHAHRLEVPLARPAHQLEVLAGEEIPLAAGVLADDDVRSQVAQPVAAAAVELAASREAGLAE